MSRYCYTVQTDDDPDQDALIAGVTKIYRKPKFASHFAKDEALPFRVIYADKQKQVCVDLTSRAKKNIARIEDIHSAIKAVDLKIAGIKLSKPTLFQPEQCKWWEEDCDIQEGQKWTTLSHHGPYFGHLSEPYEPHGAPLIYDGEEYELEPEEEYIANFYARRIISEEDGNVAISNITDPTFNKNFWTDFKEYLTPEHKRKFKKFDLVDFSAIVETLRDMKEEEKAADKLTKDAKKAKTAARKLNYGYALINSTREPIGNFTVEPAAIFYGRGENPARGKIKRDIYPEDVTINVGENDPIPDPPEGYEWGAVVHNHNAAWLASWKDTISGENKYVLFGAEGQLKGKSDLKKYEKARKLNTHLSTVQEGYTADIDNRNLKTRQLGTVLYLIDNHGLRVGGAKDDDDTDTVGASTLRVEHIKLKPPNTIVFDFLGKDSIRFFKEIPVSDEVYRNIAEFKKNKDAGTMLFDKVTAADINNYLKTFDREFTAKVFRTRLASTVMYDALKKLKIRKDLDPDEKKKLFIKANSKVAELLNHRRTATTKSLESAKKAEDELKELRKELKRIKNEGKSTTAIDKKIKKKKNQIESKKDTLNIAITTSLQNYIDPRLVSAWIKKVDIPVPKIYSAALQKKFKWAIDMTDKKWDYITSELLPSMAELQPVDPAERTPRATPVPAPKIKKALPKPPAQAVAKGLSVRKDTSTEVRILPYSEKSFIVVGDTRPYKEQFTALFGKFGPNWKIDGVQHAGWIFSNKREAAVEEIIYGKLEDEEPEEEEPAPKPVKPARTYKRPATSLFKTTKFKPGQFEKLFGTKDEQVHVEEDEEELSLGLIDSWFYDQKLSLPQLREKAKVYGITSKVSKDALYELLKSRIPQTLRQPKPDVKVLIDEYDLSDETKQLLRDFAQDPNLAAALSAEIYNNTHIFTEPLLTKFLTCVGQSVPSSYMSIVEKVLQVVNRGNVFTNLFLLHMYYNIDDDLQDEYLQLLEK